MTWRMTDTTLALLADHCPPMSGVWQRCSWPGCTNPINAAGTRCCGGTTHPVLPTPKLDGESTADKAEPISLLERIATVTRAAVQVTVEVASEIVEHISTAAEALVDRLLFRVGIPEVNGRLVAEARAAGYPVMISASRFYRRRADGTRSFQAPGPALAGLDIHLDSAGFTAMSQWNGYPWSPVEYIDFVEQGTWTSWSQMDLCCEPEVAGDDAAILARVQGTADYLAQLVALADERGMARPCPVLQGWSPEHYALSAQLADDVLNGDWPALVGIGSVCRRNLHGEDGILAILDAIDGILPAHVKVHLFGVKSAALAHLADHPRVYSADSMAWDFAARQNARKAGIKNTVATRAAEMHRWFEAQVATLTPAAA
jgi:hypothetical protein